MRSTFKVLFFVKRNAAKKNGNAPIIARITIDQIVAQFNTKLEITPINWSVSAGKAAGRSAEAVSINSMLDSIRSSVHQHYHSLLEMDGYVTAERVKNAFLGKIERGKTLIEFFEMHNEQYLQKVKMNTADKTYSRYELTKKRLIEFMKLKYSVSDMLIKEINVVFIDNFLLHIKNHYGCTHNTAMKFVQRFRTVVNFAKNTGLVTADPFGNYKVKFEQTDRDYLTMEEITAIYNKKFASKRLEQVRDLFIFSCYTALSYIDVCELTQENIRTSFDGNLWIMTKRHKTNVASNIRLLEIPKAILEKYKDKLPNGMILPIISNQKVNDYLKEIATICNINKNLTFHVARHSCATSVLIANGVPIETVSKILGHTNIRTTQIYARITDVKVSNDMELLAQKLDIAK
ncbi:tyrosine-type recombinase/integrase [Bacteroides thetaiotaomicron]|uniref:site-specific integrase n=1 Tax=Bacteroides thetaiotaomicron TaxID=818 RepID=UPI001C017F70|nr:site-specific integrase [Bacteroides thetaiotaomicron]MBT9898384.1 tyrosine-type recombinase/integrase [Bacteroides thetaiotaomicron]